MKIPKIYKREYDNNDRPIRVIDIKKSDMIPVTYYPDVDFEDAKSVERYVKTCKTIIRQSDSYKNLMYFLKRYKDFNSCFFLPKVKKYKGSKLTIEMHHTGLVMEDIIKAVLYKRYEENEDYGCQAIGKEVMLDHYKGWISLTALSATSHDLIHEPDSTLFIPLGMEDFGDITIFFEEYKLYIKKYMPDLFKKFESYKLLSDAVENIEDIIPEYMDVNIIYYNKEGVSIPDMEEILKIVTSN